MARSCDARVSAHRLRAAGVRVVQGFGRLPRFVGLDWRENAHCPEPALHRLAQSSLLFRARVFIEPADAEAGQRRLDLALERDASGALYRLLREYPLARKLLLGVFGCSPHLANLAAGDPARLARLLLDAPERVVARLLSEIGVFEAPDEAELMRLLRVAKQEAALLVALADLTKAWDTMTATRALTDIADTTLSRRRRLHAARGRRRRKTGAF